MSTLATLVVSLVGDIGGFTKSMQDAEKQAESTGSGIRGAFEGAGRAVVGFGKVAAGAALAGIGALTTAGIGGIAAFNDWAGELDSLGDVLGTSADESAALAVAIRGVGGDTQAITGQMARLVSGLKDAKGSLGPTGKLMKQLGIAFEDTNGNMLPTTQILEGIANKIAGMPDGLEKTALMTELFGKSGKDLADTMNALADGGLAAAEQKARDLGLAIGDEGVANSIEFGKSLETAKMAAQGLFVQIGSFLLPIILPLLQKFVEAAQTVLPQLLAAFQAVMGWIQTNVGPVFNAVLQTLQGVVNWVASNWPQISGQITTAFETARAALEPIIAAISAFIQAVFSAVAKFLQEHGEEIRAFLEQAWTTVSEIIGTIAQIVSTIVTEVFGAIARFLNEHGAEIQKIIEGVWNAMRTIIETVINAIKGIVNTVMAILKGDWQTAWNTIKSTVEGIWNGIKSFIETAIGTVKRILETAWNAIKSTVRDAWTGVRTAIENAVQGVLDFLGSLPGRMVEFGRNMIEGLINGIRNAAGAFIHAIEQMIRDALGWIADLLGIGSPSRVMAAVGQQMMAGLALGITRNAQLPQLALDAAAIGNVTAQVGAGGAGSTSSQFVFGNGAIVVNALPGQDPHAIAQAVLDEALRRADSHLRSR